MNKIVNEHVLASELPPRLRNGINDGAFVTVTVQVEQGGPETPSTAYLRQLMDIARHAASGVTGDEAVARIRALRDEGDE